MAKSIAWALSIHKMVIEVMSKRYKNISLDFKEARNVPVELLGMDGEYLIVKISSDDIEGVHH